MKQSAKGYESTMDELVKKTTEDQDLQMIDFATTMAATEAKKVYEELQDAKEVVISNWKELETQIEGYFELRYKIHQETFNCTFVNE